MIALAVNLSFAKYNQRMENNAVTKLKYSVSLVLQYLITGKQTRTVLLI